MLKLLSLNWPTVQKNHSAFAAENSYIGNLACMWIVLNLCLRTRHRTTEARGSLLASSELISKNYVKYATSGPDPDIGPGSEIGEYSEIGDFPRSDSSDSGFP